MSTKTLAARLTQPVAAAGVTVAIIAAGLLAPQAASARPPSGSPTSISCTTAPISTLVAEGSVGKKRGKSGTGYYTTGAGDFLGTDKTIVKSVAQTAPGYYRRVDVCA